MWRAIKYTAPRLEDKAQVIVDEAGTKATSREERERMLIEAAFPRAPDTGEQAPLPDGGLAYQRINEALVDRLLAKTRNANAPGGDSMGAEAIKVMWEWAPGRITGMHSARPPPGELEDCQRSGNPQTRKPDYTQVRAHRVIFLLDSISKLVERTAAHLIADHLERRNKLHDGQ